MHPSPPSNHPTTSQALLFSEELLLLLLDRDSGQLAPVPGRAMRCAIAGATLLDLALKNRVDTDLEHLFVVDATPVNDDLLDPALAMIAGAAERETAHWVDRLAEPSIANRTREGSLERLVERGILLRGRWRLSVVVAPGLANSPVSHGRTARPGAKSNCGVMSALFNEEIPGASRWRVDQPDPCLRVLRAPAVAGGNWRDARKRIELICRLDLIGQAVFEAIRHAGIRPGECQARRGRPFTRRSGKGPWPRSRSPTAEGLPLAGNAFGLTGDTGAFLARTVPRTGPRLSGTRILAQIHGPLPDRRPTCCFSARGRHLFQDLQALRGTGRWPGCASRHDEHGR